MSCVTDHSAPASSSHRCFVRINLPAGASSDSKAAVRAPPELPRNPALRIISHRIQPALATPAESEPQAKFVCVCCGGAIEVRMTSFRKKASKLLRRIGGCFSCSHCATTVNCCSGSGKNTDNHAVINNNYYGNEGGAIELSSHGGGRQQAVPDLISMQ